MEEEDPIIKEVNFLQTQHIQRGNLLGYVIVRKVGSVVTSWVIFPF